MLARIWFILIALFFVLMNVLLWRSEVRGRGQPGSAVPLEIVWKKILTAPDDSSLELRRRGEKIGFLHWVPNIGEELTTGKVMSEDVQPEGMVGEVTGYSIDVDGSLSDTSLENLRFHTHLELATNQLWRQFNLRINFRPAVYQIEADAALQKLTLRVQSDQEETTRSWPFEELRDPRALIRQLGGPLAATIVQLDLIPALGAGSEKAALDFKLDWSARHDWMTVGHARFKVYRLEARLLDRFQAVVLVSPVGEILRVELPGEIVLINDAFL